MAKDSIANCRIRYLENSIFVDFQPVGDNFSYWVHKKINDHRWKQTGEGIRLGSEVTKEEAVYIESLAISQWGPEGCEVIKPLAEAETIQQKTQENHYGQLSLL